MARVANIGFEMQSLTSGMEVSTVSGAGATLESTIVRSGSRSLKLTSAASTRQGIVHQWRSGSNAGPFYLSLQLQIGTLPGNDSAIMLFSSNNTISSTVIAEILVNSSGQLILKYVDASSVFQTVGTSSALTTGRWYEIGLKFDNTGGAGAATCEGKIDGVTFATTAVATYLANVLAFRVGSNMGAESQTAGVFYFDDIRCNDSAAGTGQTGYPTLGEKLVMALPTGSGDNAAEVGTFASINELPPTDTSTGSSDRIELQTTTSIGDYNVTDSSALGISNLSVVTMVAPMIRVAGATSTAANYTTRVKSAASGTVSASASQALASATFLTNPTSTTAFLNQHVSYTDPTTGNAWFPIGTNSIDNMQVGAATTDGNPDTYVTWLGAYVGFVAGTAGKITSAQQAVNRSNTF